MKVGSIFIWKKFNQQADEKIKNRYFIYFGRSPAFINPIYVYIGTTTSKIEYYTNGGRFANNNIVWFNKDECSFTKDCVLDLDRNYLKVESSNIIGKTIIDVIPEVKLRKIYEKILNSYSISIENKNNIHDSFNRDNITGLKNPK